jgi:ribosome maturation factor RimP
MIVPCIFLLVLLQQQPQVQSFSSIVNNLSSRTIITPATATALYSTKPSGNKRPPSLVSDPAGLTPDQVAGEPEILKLSDIPELVYDEDAHPIPHQPWRRGVTDGCEDPIDAPWRQEAEELIGKAVRLVGAKHVDCTWFLTVLEVTIDPDLSEMVDDPLKTKGPPIAVTTRAAPQWKDPLDPNPEDLQADELGGPYWELDEKLEADLKSKKYARQEDDEEDLGLDPNEMTGYATEESRSDEREGLMEERAEAYAKEPQYTDREAMFIDTAKVSTIAGAILDILQEKEDRLRVLERHEIVLSCPGAPGYLSTQSQFDANRDRYIVVYTHDPWESNRILTGQLIERNSMDLLLNQKGRMVTIPLNFVSTVRLSNPRPDGDAQDLDEKGDYGDEQEFDEQADDGDDDEDDDEEYEYEVEDEDEDE